MIYNIITKFSKEYKSTILDIYSFMIFFSIVL